MVQILQAQKPVLDHPSLPRWLSLLSPEVHLAVGAWYYTLLVQGPGSRESKEHKLCTGVSKTSNFYSLSIQDLQIFRQKSKTQHALPYEYNHPIIWVFWPSVYVKQVAPSFPLPPAVLLLPANLQLVRERERERVAGLILLLNPVLVLHLQKACFYYLSYQRIPLAANSSTFLILFVGHRRPHEKLIQSLIISYMYTVVTGVPLC